MERGRMIPGVARWLLVVFIASGLAAATGDAGKGRGSTPVAASPINQDDLAAIRKNWLVLAKGGSGPDVLVMLAAQPVDFHFYPDALPSLHYDYGPEVESRLACAGKSRLVYCVGQKCFLEGERPVSFEGAARSELTPESKFPECSDGRLYLKNDPSTGLAEHTTADGSHVEDSIKITALTSGSLALEVGRDEMMGRQSEGGAALYFLKKAPPALFLIASGDTYTTHMSACENGAGSVGYRISDVDGDGRKEVEVDESSYYICDPFYHKQDRVKVYNADGTDVTERLNWQPEIPCPVCPAGALDGDSAWQGVPVREMSTYSVARYGAGRWGGPADLSFRLQACHDEKSVRFRAAVTDQKVVLDPGLGDVFKDHMELWIEFAGPQLDLDQAEEEKREFCHCSDYKTQYYEGAFQLGLVPAGGGTVDVKVWKKDLNNWGAWNDAPADLSWAPDVSAVGARWLTTKDGYEVTARMPLPARGKLTAAAVCVVDNDDPTKSKQKSMMCSSPIMEDHRVRGGALVYDAK